MGAGVAPEHRPASEEPLPTPHIHAAASELCLAPSHRQGRTPRAPKRPRRRGSDVHPGAPPGAEMTGASILMFPVLANDDCLSSGFAFYLELTPRLPVCLETLLTTAATHSNNSTCRCRVRAIIRRVLTNISGRRRT